MAWSGEGAFRGRGRLRARGLGGRGGVLSAFWAVQIPAS